MSTLPQNQPKPETIGTFLAKQKQQLQMALPKHLNVDRLLRIALTEYRRVPGLSKCTPESFYASLLQAGQLGIEPGGSLGQGYLIPYGTECKFMLGYRGMIDLARRSGEIESIGAHVVYENDKFELEYGFDEKLVHKPAISNPGEMILVYAIAKFKNGGKQLEVMTRFEVELCRKRSASAKSSASPWHTDYNEMCRKTVIRRIFKYLPLSIELREQIEREEEKEFIDGEYNVVENENSLAAKLKSKDAAPSVDIPVNKETGEITMPVDTTIAPGAAEFFGADDEHLQGAKQ